MDKKEILLWLAAALILAFFISPFASSSPDGLEKVAGDKGFLERGEVEPAFISPVPDYTWPGIDNEGMATGLAGIFGTLIVFGLAYGIGAMIKR
jgi:cobalt/nickel transport protein